MGIYDINLVKTAIGYQFDHNVYIGQQVNDNRVVTFKDLPEVKQEGPHNYTNALLVTLNGADWNSLVANHYYSTDITSVSGIDIFPAYNDAFYKIKRDNDEIQLRVFRNNANQAYGQVLITVSSVVYLIRVFLDFVSSSSTKLTFICETVFNPG